MLEEVVFGNGNDQKVKVLEGVVTASKWNYQLEDEMNAKWVMIAILHPDIGVAVGYCFTKREYLELIKLLN